MRRKISLYIAGQPVDLDEQSFILFNYTMEEMSNPTIVRNSFSQSITLQGTPRNNKIFGSIFRADRQTQYADSFTGVHFDPARKTPFVIYNEINEILEEGYLKLNKVSRKNAGVEYNITLYGGLGSFFYGLMYKDDGSKRSLYDLNYFDMNGRMVYSFPISPDAISVKDAWSYLAGETPNYTTWNIINFAPAYNGIPENFDATKALYLNKNIYMNLPVTETKDDVEYSMKSNASTRLMKFTNPHSEWEVCDLRWYLQRPAMSIKAIINAICDPENNGGFQVDLDEAFFNADNPYYENAWMSLQLIAAEDRNSSECLNNLLKSSVSPAEILISFAKIYGLVFLYNTGEKKVSIMLRKTFYQSDSMIDLTSRIQRSDIEVNPLVADSLIYQFGDKAIGQFAEEYKKDYQREYGIQKVNTGYEFNAATTILTKDLAFKDSVEVMEVNRMFVSKWSRSGNQILQSFYLPAYEEVSVQLWATTTDEEGVSEEQSEDFPITTRLGGLAFDNPDYEYGDWLPKVQLHKDNKPEDGSYTLLFFSGIKESPIGFGSMRKPYWLTNDHPDMNLLNDNTPCWNLTGEEIRMTTLPSFRKNLIASDGKTIEASWEWGVPFARAVPGIEGDNTIYENWWKNYLQDLYDDDTRKMTCKVDLRGLFVNQTLMRRMFWYNNSLWRLNKIINHSLTTWDDTECEFIKVQDINNYIG